MRDWNEDNKWSRKFHRVIRMILGLALFRDAPIEEDQERNTDLWSLVSPPMNGTKQLRAAIRIRRSWYYDQYDYRNEFTIRSTRPSGTATEFQKMLDGWAQIYFYGFANEQESGLRSYHVADMHWFTCWLKSHWLETGEFPGKKQSNGDGSSEFRVYKWSDVPKRSDGSSFVLYQHDSSGTADSFKGNTVQTQIDLKVPSPATCPKASGKN